MRTGSRRVLSVVFGAVFAVMTTTAASAHATYEDSDPPDGATVGSPPSEVTADFSEPLISEDSYMRVTDPCGRNVGDDTLVTADRMSVQMSGDAAGRYTVSWRARSRVDNHPTTGSFSFTSTGGEPCPGEQDEEDRGGGGSAEGGGGSEERGDPSSGNEGTTLAQSSASGREDKQTRHSKNRHAKHDRSKRGKEKEGNDRADAGPVAQGTDSGVPEAPSALDGIPLDGLLLTLAVSALIGAAAGKIYVSLSGDDS